jgi:DNA invertase Pin-like site-specific DNA recombinase
MPNIQPCPRDYEALERQGMAREENLCDLEARGWTIEREYVDSGISGSKDRRPALDQLLADARRRRFDCLVCWRLDRLGRNLKHLITFLDDLQALGVGFVTLGEPPGSGP